MVVGTEVSSGEIKRRLNDAQRAEVDRHLSEGRSVALYGDERGIPALIVTFGSRDADLPHQFPPSHYGRGELVSYVPAPREAKPMRSPLMEWDGGPPQIHRPRVAPSHTEYPSVQIEMRTSSHPRRGNEFLNLSPSRRQEVPQMQPEMRPTRIELVEPGQPRSEPAPPAEPQLSSGARWWADHLAR
jgi:hypothetical protein